MNNLTIWSLFGLVCAAGAVGGLINALLTDKGFALPGRIKVGDVRLYTPGIFGNLVISAIAAGTSWGLYGPLARSIIVGQVPAGVKQPDLILSLYELGGALLVGIVGAKWLTNESEKSLLKASVVKATAATANPTTAQVMALSTPQEIAVMANNL